MENNNYDGGKSRGMDRFLNYARDINRKVGKTMSSDKAKKIRKNLIIWGVIIVIVSAIVTAVGVWKMFSGFTNLNVIRSFTGPVIDSSAGCPEMGEPGWFECVSGNMGSNQTPSTGGDSFSGDFSGGLDFGSLVGSALGGFALVALGGFGLSAGIIMIKVGLAIIIGDVGSKFLDTAPKCPKCGDPVDQNEIYCNKCGADLRNKTKCSNCGTQNEIDDEYCRSCGSKL